MSPSSSVTLSAVKFNNLLFCDEILKNVSSLTVSEELFLQRTARCRAVIPSLVLKSR